MKNGSGAVTHGVQFDIGTCGLGESGELTGGKKRAAIRLLYGILRVFFDLSPDRSTNGLQGELQTGIGDVGNPAAPCISRRCAEKDVVQRSAVIGFPDEINRIDTGIQPALVIIEDMLQGLRFSTKPAVGPEQHAQRFAFRLRSSMRGGQQFGEDRLHIFPGGREVSALDESAIAQIDAVFFQGIDLGGSPRTDGARGGGNRARCLLS